MAQILGTFTFKLPGGVEINYQVWRDMANEEMEKIDEWIKSNRACDYFINSNTI